MLLWLYTHVLSVCLFYLDILKINLGKHMVAGGQWPATAACYCCWGVDLGHCAGA
jgi:hypothetical protein